MKTEFFNYRGTLFFLERGQVGKREASGRLNRSSWAIQSVPLAMENAAPAVSSSIAPETVGQVEKVSSWKTKA